MRIQKCTPRVQKGSKEYPPKAGGGVSVSGAVGGLYNWITGKDGKGDGKDGKDGKGEL